MTKMRRRLSPTYPRQPAKTEAAPDSGAPAAVYVVEDNRVLRESTATLLAARGVTVSGTAGSCDEALRELGRLRPRIVLLEAGLGDTVEVVARLREAAPQTRVIMMNFPPSHDGLVDFVRAGVAGFILKDATIEEIAGTMRRVAAGSPALPRVLGGRLLSHVASQSRSTTSREREARAYARLTRREREVIGLIADGLSNKEIAARLHVATHTVKSHVHAVLEKLGLRTRLEVAAFAHAQMSERALTS